MSKSYGSATPVEYQLNLSEKKTFVNQNFQTLSEEEEETRKNNLDERLNKEYGNTIKATIT